MIGMSCKPFLVKIITSANFNSIGYGDSMVKYKLGKTIVTHGELKHEYGSPKEFATTGYGKGNAGGNASIEIYLEKVIETI